MDIPGAAAPHIKVIAHSGLLVDDSKLCRGELLIILRLMICQFRMVRLLHHKVAPVSLYPLLSLSYFHRLLTRYSTGFGRLVHGRACTYAGVLF